MQSKFSDGEFRSPPPPPPPPLFRFLLRLGSKFVMAQGNTEVSRNGWTKTSTGRGSLHLLTGKIEIGNGNWCRAILLFARSYVGLDIARGIYIFVIERITRGDEMGKLIKIREDKCICYSLTMIRVIISLYHD